VHHCRFPSVIETVSSLLAAGVVPSSLVVVDNSEDLSTAEQLRQALPAESHLIVIPNDGYAAALNRGLRQVLEMDPKTASVLVATHEVLLGPDCLKFLQSTLSSDPSIGAVGPILFDLDSASDPPRPWSAGGTLSPILRIPDHNRTVPSPPRPVSVPWLDGALCLYRIEALAQIQFWEGFFMYYEELDHHLRLQKAGFRVVLDPSATAWQSSAGIPPFYDGRNLFLYLRRDGLRFRPYLSTSYRGLRLLAKATLRRATPGAVAQYLAGFRTAIKESRHSAVV
jgi:GT2 family glycosyltransferase